MERSKFINPLFQRTETLAAEVPEQPSFQEPEDIPAVPAERIEPPETVERPKAAAVSKPVADPALEPAPHCPRHCRNRADGQVHLLLLPQPAPALGRPLAAGQAGAPPAPQQERVRAPGAGPPHGRVRPHAPRGAGCAQATAGVGSAPTHRRTRPSTRSARGVRRLLDTANTAPSR